MKKILLLILAFILVLSCLTSGLKSYRPCDEDGDEDSNDNGSDIGDTGSSDSSSDYLYSSFTPYEKKTLRELFGFVFPFAPNNEYYFDEYEDEDLGERGVNYYTVGNTEEEFREYLEALAIYTDDGSDVDNRGNTWYYFKSGNVSIELCYYEDDEEQGIELFIYTVLQTEPDVPGTDTPGGSDPDPDIPGTDAPGGSDPDPDVPGTDTPGGSDPTPDTPDAGDPSIPSYKYSDFSADEKALMKEFLGFILPFAPCNEYKLEEYTSTELGEHGLNYYTVGNTSADFNAYLLLFGSFVSAGTNVDEDGDTWYFFDSDEVMIDVAYYESEGKYYIDLYAYYEIDSDDTDPDKPDQGYKYSDFTSEEKTRQTEILGFVLPFVPTNEYSLEEYWSDSKEQHGFNYYTVGNTASDFAAYLKMFASYEASGTDVDEYGDTWYYFDRDNVFVDVSYYESEGTCYIDLYAYYDIGSGNSGTGSGDSDTDNDGYLYTDFSGEQKAQLTDLFGFVIPFAPTDEYYLEEYDDKELGEHGYNYYTVGNTSSDFASYLDLFAFYESLGTAEDDYGDTWYFFSNGEVFVDVSFYESEGQTYIDLYVYYETNSDGSGDADSGGSGSTDYPSEVKTNRGAGLPSSDSGIYKIDLTKALTIKDTTDLSSYVDGCPTTGTPAVLVIPVDFSDRTASSLGYTTDTVEKAFNGVAGSTDYYSVHDYYFTSSYGKLDLEIEVLDFWFRPSHSSSYYASKTTDYFGEQAPIGDQMIMDEALQYLESRMDLSKFDSDGNDVIDAVVLVNTLEINSDSDFNWAYRYWNIYVDENDYYYEYDGVSANDYVWMPYQFLFETYDENGDVSYDDKTAINTYTFIHEFGHVLGADDYYDTAYVSEPMGGYDVMDAMAGDHNPFTKFNLGWLTTSRLVVTDSTLTLTLEDFSQNGDTVIIANNWSDDLGAYQEYYVLMYYTQNGLNGGEFGYFDRSGVLVYHVNASVIYDTSDGEVYYAIYNTNTDPSDENGYGTEDNLIEYVKSENGYYTYSVGDSLPEVYDDFGERLCYTFTVDSLDSDYATITFTSLD